MSTEIKPPFTSVKHFESSKRCSGCGITEAQLRKKNGGALLACARCKWTRYCSQECQKGEWPAHKSKCTTNANTANALASKPEVHPKLLSDFRAWLPHVVKPVAWTTLNALEAKTKPQEISSKCFFIELIHVPEGKTPRERFRLKECAVWPRALAKAAVAHDRLVADDFEKTLEKRGNAVAPVVVKVGEVVKVIGFDSSEAALESHNHYDDWATSGVLEKSVSGEMRF
ncbi:hypothetical protein SCHPADRAFT_63844 [Schizopora paradoxa]|uniref:MYND-type domain-containing protein n=1 Tax=Schizopora paradoxa TaxID=27342 RepID=A0A0H2S6D0_9AGAM|nr:hypothetical protein SCHPADRAFT_63844 [Schizopora paradoxa]